MTKTIAALLILCGTAAAVAGCSSDDDNSTPASVSSWSAAHPTTAAPAPAPASTTAAPAAPPAAAENAALRAKTCQDMAPFLAELAKADPAAAQESADNTIRNLPSTPEWATMSQADRDATVAGIRDAAKGQCG